MRADQGGLFWRLALPLLAALLLSACGGGEQPLARSTATPRPPAAASPSAPAAEATAAPTADATAQPTAADATPVATADDSGSIGENSSLQEIAMIDADGTLLLLDGPRRIEVGSVPLFDPDPDQPARCEGTTQLTWSPDGYRLVTSAGIMTFDDDPAEPPLLSPLLDGWDHRWSRDSQQLAWMIGVEEHTDALLVAGPDGEGAEVAATGHWGYTGQTEWAPDGSFVIAGRHVAPPEALESPLLPPAWREDRDWGKDAVWSPDGKLLVWSLTSEAEPSSTIQLMLWDGSETRTLGTLSGEGIVPDVTSRQRLHWLPDGSGVLVALPLAGEESHGTWRVDMDGGTTLISDKVLCDVDESGDLLLVRSRQGELSVIDTVDGSSVVELGKGVSAAWRPTVSGNPPPAPLALRSPRLSLESPPATGPAVRELQELLVGLGYDLGELDGVYGQQTDAAVRQFQQDRGLPVDGVVGPVTWGALRSPIMTTADLERRLESLGYHTGTVDDVWDDSTQEALTAFMNASGIDHENGFDLTAVWKALRSPDAPREIE